MRTREARLRRAHGRWPGAAVVLLAPAPLRAGAARLLRLRRLHGDARQHGRRHRGHDGEEGAHRPWQRHLLRGAVPLGHARGGRRAERLLLRLRAHHAARRLAGGARGRQVGVRRRDAGHGGAHAAAAARGAAGRQGRDGAARGRRPLRGRHVAQHARTMGAMGAPCRASQAGQLCADGTVSGPRGGVGGLWSACTGVRLGSHLLRHGSGRRAVVRRLGAHRQGFPGARPLDQPSREEIHPRFAGILEMPGGGGGAAPVGPHPALGARVGGGRGALLRGLGLHHVPHAAAVLHGGDAEFRLEEVGDAVGAAVRGHDRLSAQRQHPLRLARQPALPQHHAGAEGLQLHRLPGADAVPVPGDGGALARRGARLHDGGAGHRRLRLLRLQREPAGPGARARERHHGAVLHCVHPVGDDQPVAHRIHRHRKDTPAVGRGVLRGQRRVPVRRRLLRRLRLGGAAAVGGAAPARPRRRPAPPRPGMRCSQQPTTVGAAWSTPRPPTRGLVLQYCGNSIAIFVS